VPRFDRVGTCNGAARGQDSGIPILRTIRQPRRFVDRISDDGVFVAILCPDVAGEYGTERNSDTEVDGQPPQLRRERTRCRQCRRRRFIDTQRRTEYGQDRVAAELVDQAPPFLDRAITIRKKSSRICTTSCLRRSGCGQRCRSHQIDEQNRDLADIAGHRSILLKRVPCNIGTDVSAEQIA
jgi:hypothetical protein